MPFFRLYFWNQVVIISGDYIICLVLGVLCSESYSYVEFLNSGGYFCVKAL